MSFYIGLLIYVVIGLIVAYFVYRMRLKLERKRIQNQFENNYISRNDLDGLTLLDDTDITIIIFSFIMWYIAIGIICIFFIHDRIVKFIERKNKQAIISLKKDLEQTYPEKFI